MSENYKEPVEACPNALQDVDARRSLQALLDLAASSRGPNGRFKVLQSSDRGHATATSSSSRLLPWLRISKPVTQLVARAVQQHCEDYADGGLALTMLSCSLILSCSLLGYARRVVTNCNSYLCAQLRSYLSSKDCNCRLQLDFSHTGMLRCLLATVLRSKAACRLTPSDIDSLTLVLLKTCLLAMPTGDGCGPWSSSSVHLIATEGYVSSNSTCFSGLLVPLSLTGGSHSFGRFRALSKDGRLKVAVVDLSLVGDAQEWQEDIAIESHGAADENMSNLLDAAALKQLLEFSERAVAAGVDVLLCQRCVHPQMTKHLARQGVLVIDRLSAVLMPLVLRLSGAQVISSVLAKFTEKTAGSLASLQHRIVNSKSYWHLVGCEEERPLATLFLSAWDELAMLELRQACCAALRMFELCMANPWVVPGGGCTEIHLALYLLKMPFHVSDETLKSLHCSKGEFQALAENFAQCLAAIACSLDQDKRHHVIDTLQGHQFCACPPVTVDDKTWQNRLCECGLMTAQNLLRGHWQTIGQSGSTLRCNQMTEEETLSKTVPSSYNQCGDEPSSSFHHSISSCSSSTCKNETLVSNPGKNITELGQVQSLLLDCLSVKVAVLSSAVEIANAALRVHTVIAG